MVEILVGMMDNVVYMLGVMVDIVGPLVGVLGGWWESWWFGGHSVGIMEARAVLGICHMEFDSLASKSGNFSSPQYPEPYPASIHCYYLFKGQECLNDFVDISTISVTNVRQLVGRYCGVEVPVPLLTMKPRMEIIFKTNHAHERTGFFGMYQFTDESFIHPPQSTRNVTGCGGTLTGVGGDLVSPGYPETFPKDVDCNWLIRVDYDKHIYIRVLELQLKGSIDVCKEYTCPKSQYCMNSESRSCTETREYCIDRSLVCDGLPNCSGEDFSDEDKCE
ncbi:hypothetical protein HPB52_018645 [Rhipicephalus sanguineus]|uniref:CUB domain-containing protein n=1 Tax=Rhipicephalus sanguineus TaxID=34632 RepID=A0A9D4PPF8_RHISA|nr:hypothetical protein HPB52_018645 [Rhipicephalus sanguineus]